MPRKLFDTSVLIRQWQRRYNSHASVADVRNWASELRNLYQTTLIASPVRVEFLAGVTSRRQLRLSRSFLAEFRLVDDGSWRQQDWVEAERIANRVPPTGRRRQLGDCLIVVLAKRHSCEVITHDTRFPQP